MSIDGLDLNLLRVFDGVLRERSVTAAAAALRLSQPAASNALARLRERFGDALFIRTPSGMDPTPLAKVLAEPIQQALGLIDGALVRDRRFEPGTSERTFRLHMSDIGEMVFLPPLLERLATAAPGLRVEVTALPHPALQDAMSSGEVDLAVGFLPELGRALRSAELFRDPYMALIRADHPAIGARLTKRAFSAARHCLVRSIGSGHTVIEEALRTNGLEKRIALRVPHFTVVPMILERTELVVCVPSRVARVFESNGRFRALRLPVPVPRADVRLHWHERFEQDSANAWMRELLLALYAGR